MAERDKVNELNRQFGGVRAARNVSAMDDNLRAIERLVRAAADDEAGLVSVYRPLDESEKREIAKTETDEIANAYHVEMAGDDKVYYITYKPQVEKGRGKSGKLEHVNRSTPFVQMLLDRVGNEFSFLFCHSKVRETDTPDPPVADGFRVTHGEREHLEGKNKYELFFLIECKDNIDASERITNLIDSVLLDVDGNSGDFFAHMSYASLEHTPDDDDREVPEIDFAVQSQLNNIIMQIRESGEVRQRILDFMTRIPESDLYAHMKSRNDAFLNAQAAAPREINALNSQVVCRMMPIGVFLNAMDNDRIPYTVTGQNGERAVFYTEINPTVAFSGHMCPHCGRYLTADNAAVAVNTASGCEVGCESCASKCAQKGCARYAFDDGGCAVCHKILCTEHSRKSIDSDDRLCSDCVRVFRDSGTGEPLSPRDAAVRGCEEHYVETEVGRLGKTGAINRFKSIKLLRKSACIRCKTVTKGESGDTEYRYYLESETARCDKCGENFCRDDLKKTTDGETLCVFDRVDCSCGSSVRRDKAYACAEKGCTHGFCESCVTARKLPTDYYHAIKLFAGKSKPIDVSGKIYCPDHAAVCKVCGKTVALSAARTCETCGGTVCADCVEGNKCATCARADTVTETNYKQVSTKKRLARLNGLPLREKFARVAVLEDNENVVYVTICAGQKQKRIYNKLTGQTQEWTGEKQ